LHLQEPAAAAKPAVQVSAGQVKQLRDKSGAGMMDCKKALAECGGDVEVGCGFAAAQAYRAAAACRQLMVGQHDYRMRAWRLRLSKWSIVRIVGQLSFELLCAPV
jgi:hypothetical protein